MTSVQEMLGSDVSRRKFLEISAEATTLFLCGSVVPMDLQWQIPLAEPSVNTREIIISNQRTILPKKGQPPIRAAYTSITPSDLVIYPWMDTAYGWIGWSTSPENNMTHVDTALLRYDGTPNVRREIPISYKPIFDVKAAFGDNDYLIVWREQNQVHRLGTTPVTTDLIAGQSKINGIVVGKYSNIERSHVFTLFDGADTSYSTPDVIHANGDSFAILATESDGVSNTLQQKHIDASDPESPVVSKQEQRGTYKNQVKARFYRNPLTNDSFMAYVTGGLRNELSIARLDDNQAQVDEPTILYSSRSNVLALPSITHTEVGGMVWIAQQTANNGYTEFVAGIADNENRQTSISLRGRNIKNPTIVNNGLTNPATYIVAWQDGSHGYIGLLNPQTLEIEQMKPIGNPNLLQENITVVRGYGHLVYAFWNETDINGIKVQKIAQLTIQQ